MKAILYKTFVKIYNNKNMLSDLIAHFIRLHIQITRFVRNVRDSEAVCWGALAGLGRVNVKSKKHLKK